MFEGYIAQLLSGALVTLEVALCALCVGLVIGLVGALSESVPYKWLRYLLSSVIFLVRGLPELLVLFFIYFGMAAILSALFHHYVDVSPFVAGVAALGLIFGSYAAQVFRAAFAAVEFGQLEAGKAMGLTSMQILCHIQLPQAWRHALPGLGNLWLVLLKDTAIVTLIGMSDLMTKAKTAASTTQQPFTFYLGAACIYLFITTVSNILLQHLTRRANRYIHS